MLSQAWVDSLAEAEHLFSMLETEREKGNIKSLFSVYYRLQVAQCKKGKNIFYYMAAKAVTLPLILMTSLHVLPSL